MARKLVAVTVASVLFAFIPFTSLGILGATFRRGDVDNNATTDMTDAIRILGFLFLGSATPSCLDAADANDSGKVDLSDAAYLLAFLFGGSKAPPEPFRDCGVDSTQDSLDCRESPTCGSVPADASPVLSSFAPDINKLPRPQGEDVFLVHLSFSYSHARADIARIVVTVVPPGSRAETTETSAPSFGIKGPSGKASYQASFYSTSPLGVHEYRLRLIDADGNKSAEASAKVELTASGTSRLAVTSMSPASGAVGELLTLTGTGLDASTIAHTAVSIAGVRSEIRKITSGRILCAVPDSVLTGPIVISNARGVVRTAGNFTAIPSFEVAEDGKPILLPLETKTIRAEVSGLADRSAHWYVNGIAGGSMALGTIDPSGLYTAPAVPPMEGGVTISAIASANDSLRTKTWLGLAPPQPILGAGIVNARTGGRLESKSGIVSLEIAAGALKSDLKVTRLDARFADAKDSLPGVATKSIPLAIVEVEVSGKPSLSQRVGLKALLPLWTPPKTELEVFVFNGKSFTDIGLRAKTDSSGTLAIGELPSFGTFVLVRNPGAILVVPPDFFPKPQIESVSIPVEPDGIEEGLTLPVLVRGKNFWQSFTRVRPADPALSQDLEIGSVLVNPEGTMLGFTVRIHPMPGLRAGQSLPVAFRIERLSATNQVTGQIDTDPNTFIIRGLSELIVSPNAQSHVFTIDGVHVDRLVNDSQRFSTIVVEHGAALGIGRMVGNTFTDDGVTHDLTTLDAFEASFGLLSWVAQRGLDRASIRIFEPESNLVWLEATGPVEIDGTVCFGGMRGGENAALDHPSGPGIARLGGLASGTLSGGMGGDGGVTNGGQTANGHFAGNGIVERGIGHGAHGIADAQASVAGFGARFDPQVVELDGFIEEAVSAFNPFSPPTDLIEAALRIGKLTLAAADLGTTASVNHSAPENIVAGSGGHGGRRASGQSRQMVDDASFAPGSGGGGGGGGGSTSRTETLFGVTLSSDTAKGGAGAGGGGAAGALRITTSSLFRIGPSGKLDGPGGRGGFGEPHQWTGSPGGGGGGGSGGIAKLQGTRLYNQGKVDISGGERAGAIIAQSSAPPPNGGNGRLQALNGSARGGFIYYGCRCPYLQVASPTVSLCWPTGRKRADITFPFLSGIRGIGSATNVLWLPFLPPLRSGLLILDDHKKVWFTSVPDFLAPNPEPSLSTILADLIASPPMAGFTPTDIAQSPVAPFHYFVSGVRGGLSDRIAVSEVLEYDESFAFVGTVFSRQTAEILGGALLGHLSDIDFLSDGRLVGMMAALGPIETGIHEIDTGTGASSVLLDLPDFEPATLVSFSVLRGSEDQFLASLRNTALVPGVKVYNLSGEASHAAMVIETISSPGEPGLLRIDGSLPGSNAPRVAFDSLEIPDPRYEPSTFDAPAIGSFTAPAGSATSLESLVFGGPLLNVFCQGAEKGLATALWKTSDISPPLAVPTPPADGLGQIQAAAQLDEGFNTLWVETNVGGTTHELLRRPVLYIKNANVYAPRGG